MLSVLRDAVIAAINAVIAAVGAILQTIGALFPSMPAVPNAPSVVAAINYFFPVGSVLAILTAFVAAYTVFLAIRVLLRWVKVL